jgi:carbon storage regulator CsrA
MLVLSRGRNDKVVFPSLGMSVEILRISGNKVRIGIDAPKNIPVLRHEIAEQDGHSFRDEGSNQAVGSRLSHNIRNRLHTAALGLHLLHKKLETGDHHDAEATIFKIFNELKAIEDELEPPLRVPDTESDANRLYRTLLVEDDANESELLAGFLRLSGFEVETAMDGLQAMVHLSKNERPDVVLMDMRMPRFDGSKAVAAIRANPDYRDLKIFAVSGTEQAEMQVELGPQGVDRWFSKPVDPQTIVEAIHQELALECIPA